MLSLENKDVVSIPAGEYTVLIDPIWDETAKNDKAYFEISVDVYGPQNVALKEIEKEHGREVLKQSIKNYARNKAPQDKRRNFVENQEEYSNCIRIEDIESLNCWYGYIYTFNDSAYTLRDKVVLEAPGIDAIEPIGF